MNYEGNLIIRTKVDADRYAGLQSISGHLDIRADARLDALTSVGGNLDIDADAKLDALTSVGGYLDIYADADLDTLTSVGGELHINANAKLDALTSVGGGLYIDPDAKLDAPLLSSVGGHPLPSAPEAAANLRKIAPLALQDGALEMSDWHCGSSHCLAGWAQHHLLGKTEDRTASIDGTRLLGLEATHHFHVSDDRAREFLRQYID